MSKTIKMLCVATVLLPIGANAATYNLESSYNDYSDSDYIYFGSKSNTKAYGCGDYTESAWDNEFVALAHAETLKITGDNNLYYCCDNGAGADGYWIAFYGATSVPSGLSNCSAQTNWVSLGSNKYCQATKTVVYDWCSGTTSSGIIDSADAGECIYSNGACSTFTHCAKGYYKSGTSCVACPDGGTTSGYTNGGKTDCYLVPGTTGTDDTGSWTIVDGNCEYVQ